MTAASLIPQQVQRVWGRTSLPLEFGHSRHEGPTGEVWFAPDDRPIELLVKYLFTSQRLSIQVHPDDDAARARGLARGKSEAWFVLEAEPGAVIGLGLTEHVSRERLRTTARTGAIERLIDWRPVRAGDFIYSPAGTIHAIGAGLSLIEIQQNLDVTYRLYDFGRPRELHLDDAMAVVDPSPFAISFVPYDRAEGRQILIEGGAFVVERWTGSGTIDIHSVDDQVQLIPLRGSGILDGHPASAGTVWLIDQSATLIAGNGFDVLVTYPGELVREGVYALGGL